MKTLVKIYLLMKSMAGATLSWFDICLADCLILGRDGLTQTNEPTWVAMISNMTAPAPLPEAFTDWLFDLEERIPLMRRLG